MAEETFAERFTRLLDQADLTNGEVARILGMSENNVSRLKAGRVQSLKFLGALRLAKRLGVSPWYLACMREPPGAASDVDYVDPDEDQPLESRLRRLESELAGVNNRLAEALDEIRKRLPAAQRPGTRKQAGPAGRKKAG